MRVYFNQLNRQLNQPLPKVIMVFGDEPYQQQQALDAIRQHCQQQGFDERLRFNSDEDFSWQLVLDEAQALSLFASKKLIEVELANAKPGKEGVKFFKDWCAITDNEHLLIVWGGKLGAEQTKTKWFKELDKHAWYIPVYEIERSKLPDWFRGQFQQHQLNVTPQAAALLCNLFEGNLAGAAQEVARLSLIYPEQQIDEDNVRAAVSDHSRFTVFQLAEDVLADNRNKVVQIIKRLQGEELEPVIVTWMLQREVDNLLELTLAGNQFDATCKKLRIWDNRKGLYRKALQRLNLPLLENIQQALAQFEVAYKSQGIDNPYLFIAHICGLFSANAQLHRFNQLMINEMGED
ncbi:DNA polymerase III subunit delta [Catenovulum agarivorans DS-2]|uniref:DNA polymerase III subunit delta n=1 Tax=Catenovulum agarivorans DS-2 TaxID=1328313 RepID=W7Q6G6_9ALTE|nr:DNA polymerase III subunit delta [Catenovulum agarivorans]EWH08359.1 DNA polymerase III subunit delta [Catenovulum agarivorans DS-2]